MPKRGERPGPLMSVWKQYQSVRHAVVANFVQDEGAIRRTMVDDALLKQGGMGWTANITNDIIALHCDAMSRAIDSTTSENDTQLQRRKFHKCDAPRQTAVCAAHH